VDFADRAAESGCSDTTAELGTQAEPDSRAVEPDTTAEADRSDRPEAARHTMVAGLHMREVAPALLRTRVEEDTPVAALPVERTLVVELHTAAERHPVRFHRPVERRRLAVLNKGPAEGRRHRSRLVLLLL
jgi:hypothetical protein